MVVVAMDFMLCASSFSSDREDSSLVRCRWFCFFDLSSSPVLLCLLMEVASPGDCEEEEESLRSSRV